MNKRIITPGVWPTMITAFSDDDTLDFSANAAFTDYLIQKGSHGLFALCMSSEMFFLNLQEKIDLTRCIVDAAQGRVPIIASGHTSESFDKQIEELTRISETGVDAVVLVTNRMAESDEDSTGVLENLEKILKVLPDVNFGIYECPYPFLRLLSHAELSEIAKNGRVSFLKDVSCDAGIQTTRGMNLDDTHLGLFNAHTATLIHSLSNKYNGYSGIMGNYHSDIYRWLFENYDAKPDKAQEIQAWLNWANALHKGAYPMAAKYHANLEGISFGLHTRMKNPNLLTDDIIRDIKILKNEEDRLRKELGLLE